MSTENLETEGQRGEDMNLEAEASVVFSKFLEAHFNFTATSEGSENNNKLEVNILFSVSQMINKFYKLLKLLIYSSQRVRTQVGTGKLKVSVGNGQNISLNSNLNNYKHAGFVEEHKYSFRAEASSRLKRKLLTHRSLNSIRYNKSFNYFALDSHNNNYLFNCALAYLGKYYMINYYSNSYKNNKLMINDYKREELSINNNTEPSESYNISTLEMNIKRFEEHNEGKTYTDTDKDLADIEELEEEVVENKIFNNNLIDFSDDYLTNSDNLNPSLPSENIVLFNRFNIDNKFYKFSKVDTNLKNKKILAHGLPTGLYTINDNRV